MTATPRSSFSPAFRVDNVIAEDTTERFTLTGRLLRDCVVVGLFHDAGDENGLTLAFTTAAEQRRFQRHVDTLPGYANGVSRTIASTVVDLADANAGDPVIQRTSDDRGRPSFERAAPGRTTAATALGGVPHGGVGGVPVGNWACGTQRSSARNSRRLVAAQATAEWSAPPETCESP